LRSSADGIESATRSLTGGDFRSIANSITNFARREPVLFVGACLVGGYALARIGKTALEADRSTSTSYPEESSTLYSSGDIPVGRNGEGV
jgi:hypothetical protein